MSDEQYELSHEINGGIDAVNAQLEIASQIDNILANINPYTVRSVIYSLVHQHPEVANTMLEELDYYKQSGAI
jgi:hypothetical protein